MINTNILISQCVTCDVFRWFANPQRYPWYIAIRLARAIIAPYFYLAAVLLVKRLIIGKFKAGPRDLSQWGLMRHWLMSKLMPGGDLGKVAPLVGRNLEVVSWIYRTLGAKVGKRIWWPGESSQVIIPILLYHACTLSMGQNDSGRVGFS